MRHINRVGGRTLICSAIIALTAIFFYSGTAAQESRPDSSKQPGRYQIVMHPTFRGDQYLLDTVTGQTWQLTKFSSLQGEPLAWMPMTKIDSDVEYRAFITSRKTNDATPAPASAPQAARPKPSAPLKLN